MAGGALFKKPSWLTRAELARKYDIFPSLLDTFERVGLLEPRLHDDRFVYSASDELRIQTIIKARRLGFTLDEIKILLDNSGRELKCRDQ